MRISNLSAGNYGEHSTHGKTFGQWIWRSKTSLVTEAEHYKTCLANCHQHDKLEPIGCE